MTARLFWRSATLLCLFITSLAMAGDIPGSEDHPMVSRYAGAEIIKYEKQAFTEISLAQTPIQQRGGRDKNPGAFLELEGKLTRVAYRIPEGRSTLEVYRNYEEALRGAGFEILFSCKNEECGGKPAGRPFNEIVTPKDLTVKMMFHEKDQRYLLARLTREDQTVHVAVYITKAYSIGGQDKNRVFVNTQVVESAPMQSGMVKVDAEAMAKGLDAEGHIALYGAYFDTDKADIKPESAETLAEIAKLMKSQPSLKVLIVGHTDNAGALDYNRSLSEHRAKAVMDALVSQYKVGAERMTALGVGMAAPVASNENEAGKAKNRRVELVKR
ncbi:DUF4892 domain-containing protein [Hahella sp. KA22]|uniref:OmpA family protein n=1 Tax=Hahella sp. KA22 TaxID=1628392 RepID=UPI000FDD52DB|nr:OmpA family protein [Hahella sp. KA22]AZZ94293.1 DUF4892 domain-containing protein [Hahella sp. KA22]QAY57667.1 DUF4892 domain-containing protein [Hahella sp. KA22]